MSKITRRDFLKVTVVSAATASTGGLVACSGSGKGVGITLPTDIGYFPQSIASGDPKETSVILWARILDAAKPGQDLVAGVEWWPEGNEAAKQNVANLNVLAANDNCLKVKLTGLSAKTTYNYRFVYSAADGEQKVSNTGRTRTAPAAADAAEVNYAVVSCQDYVGRYYNTLKRLVELSTSGEQDLDFVVHVGDYIYETTGDPSFQSTGGSRSVAFTDKDGAITVTDPATGQVSYQAAQSLNNYRELYKIYRTDEMLQKLHERFPVISTWDDHEYSDDCHKDTATYFDGKNTSLDGATDFEKNTTRRKNAEQAYFDFMPIEPTAGTTSGANGSITTDPATLFPNAQIYRSFNFGSNFELIVTDFRSNRPDHPIPENGNPGSVVLANIDLARALYTANQLSGNPTFVYTEAAFFGDTGINDNTTALGTLPALITAGTSVAAGADQVSTFGFFTLNGKILTSGQEASLRTAVTGAMIAEGIVAPAALVKANQDLSSGAKISILFYNGVATSWNAAIAAGTAPAGSQVLPTATEVVTKIITDTANLTPATMNSLEVGYGLSYAHFGKQSFFTSFGSRYLVVKDTYDLYNVFKSKVETVTAGASADDFDNAYGAAQWAWLFTDAIANATGRYIGIANSVSTASLVFDFRPAPAGFLPSSQTDLLPAAFRQRFYTNVDHWDGFPLRKATLLGGIAQANATRAGAGLGATSGIFLMAGDIHASYVANNVPAAGVNIPDFTGPAVSSGTYGSFLENAFNDIASSFDASAQAAGKTLVVDRLDTGPLDPSAPAKGFFQLSADKTVGSPGGNTLLETNSRKNGFTTFKVTATGVTSSYHLIDESNATTSRYSEDNTATQARFETISYNFASFGAAPTKV